MLWQVLEKKVAAVWLTPARLDSMILEAQGGGGLMFGADNLQARPRLHASRDSSHGHGRPWVGCVCCCLFTAARPRIVSLSISDVLAGWLTIVAACDHCLLASA